jgi:hypothetical protein
MIRIYQYSTQFKDRFRLLPFFGEVALPRPYRGGDAEATETVAQDSCY